MLDAKSAGKIFPTLGWEIFLMARFCLQAKKVEFSGT